MSPSSRHFLSLPSRPVLTSRLGQAGVGRCIVITKQHRDPADYDLRQLARASAEFTGAEIEAVYLEAMFAGFERQKEPTDLDIGVVVNESVPLSRLMAEQIAGLKQWAKGRARSATQVPASVGTRKLAV